MATQPGLPQEDKQTGYARLPVLPACPCLPAPACPCPCQPLPAAKGTLEHWDERPQGSQDRQDYHTMQLACPPPLLPPALPSSPLLFPLFAYASFKKRKCFVKFCHCNARMLFFAIFLFLLFSCHTYMPACLSPTAAMLLPPACHV